MPRGKAAAWPVQGTAAAGSEAPANVLLTYAATSSGVFLQHRVTNTHPPIVRYSAVQ